MQLTKLDSESILLKPHTAMDQIFLNCLVEMIEAREREIIGDLASKTELLSQDSQPLIKAP
jgi:hypothetical protein